MLMPREPAHEEGKKVWQPFQECPWALLELEGATSLNRVGRMGKPLTTLCMSLLRCLGWMLGVSWRRAAPTWHVHSFSWIPFKLKSQHHFGHADKEAAMSGP